MPMINNDVRSREEIRTAMQRALSENDTEGYASAFEEMMQRVALDIREEFDSQLEQFRQENDSRILSARGVRQLTSAETRFYQKVIEAMKARDPKQALANLDEVMPETVINNVLDDLRTDHPLLSRVNFIPTGAAVRMIVNTNGSERAAWGTLCAEIVKELTSGFKSVDTTLFKLSAFIPVCKAMLDLGPTWLDRYVREILYEALANGLEYGIVDGTGKEMPIGMTRQVGDDVTVTGGEYPRKAAVKITDLRPETVGSLLSQVATDPNGKRRRASNVILLVSVEDYYSKVMPATTLMAPDGTYRNDVMPYPMAVIPTAALSAGEAVFGLANRYFGAAGMDTDGRIEYSDDYRFLEDERVYLIKLYANGMPLDNSAFVLLDITGLKPAVLKVETVSAASES